MRLRTSFIEMCGNSIVRGFFLAIENLFLPSYYKQYAFFPMFHQDNLLLPLPNQTGSPSSQL